MKKFFILVAMMSFMLVSSVALAKKPAPAPISPDWDAAYEFGVLMSTDIDENGVVWETYHDSAQNLTWTQTAGATKEDALASIAAGSVPIDEEGFVAEGALSGKALGGVQPMVICVFVWPTPITMQIHDGGSRNVELDDWETTYWSATLVKQAFSWETSGYVYNSSGLVSTMTRSTADLCGPTTYTNAQYNDWDSGGGWSSDDLTATYGEPLCSTSGGYTYYYVSEDGDIAGESQWDYVGIKPVTRHVYYACDYYRYQELWVDVTIIE